MRYACLSLLWILTPICAPAAEAIKTRNGTVWLDDRNNILWSTTRGSCDDDQKDCEPIQIVGYVNSQAMYSGDLLKVTVSQGKSSLLPAEIASARRAAKDKESARVIETPADFSQRAGAVRVDWKCGKLGPNGNCAELLFLLQRPLTCGACADGGCNPASPGASCNSFLPAFIHGRSVPSQSECRLCPSGDCCPDYTKMGIRARAISVRSPNDKLQGVLGWLRTIP